MRKSTRIQVSLIVLSLAANALAVAAFADGPAPRLVLDPGGHTAAVRKVLITSGGKNLVSCSEDKSVKVWDIASGSCVRTFRGHQGDASEGMIYAMALSPGDEYLAVGGWMKGLQFGDRSLGSVRLYDFRRGEIVSLLRGHASVVLNLAFSPDGGFLASASADKTVKVWDLKSRRELHTLRHHGDNVYGLSISPDSARIASSSVDGSIALWESRTGRLIQSVKGHDKLAIRVQFSPSSDTLVSASHDGTVKLWDARTLEARGVLYTAPNFYTQEIAFSPDGKTLACGGTYHVKQDGVNLRPVVFLDLESKSVRRTYFAHTNTVQSICWSPDGRLAASAGDDDHGIHLYASDSLSSVKTFRGEGRTVYTVGLSPDGKTIFFGNNPEEDASRLHPVEKSISLSDFTVARHEGPPHYLRSLRGVNGMDFKFDGGLYNRTIIINGKKVMLPNQFDGIWSYAFSPNGKYAVVGSNFSLFRIDAATGAITGEFRGHNGPVTDVCVSPDSRLVYSAGSDQTIRIWPLEKFTGEHEFWDIKTLGAHWKGFLDAYYKHLDVSNQAGMRQLYRAVRRDFPHYEYTEMMVKSYPYAVPVASIFVNNDNRFLMWTPDFYYFGDKSLFRHVGWLINRGEEREGKYYTFDQFDLKYNRPDILLERLGTVPRSVIMGYREMYQRRLGRYGFTEKSLSGQLHVPEVALSLLRRDGSDASADRAYLKIGASDSMFALDRINIYHNRVPLHGTGGISVRRLNTRRHSMEVTIPLVGGRNQIQVEAVNAAGARSYLETIHIHGDAPRRKGELYLATVGISTYRNSLPKKIEAKDFISDIVKKLGNPEKNILKKCYSINNTVYELQPGISRGLFAQADSILKPLGYSMNLNYADKDAEDVVSAYRSSGNFTGVRVLRLDNEKGVAKNLSEVKRFFSAARTDDMVMLFVAGHGLKDRENNYYFATHDVDFDDPRRKGYLFEQITSL
ncbi:MAG TPA: WD40 repeat domain-containing protein, partial [Spirochaetota bacterium]|nr:WD40 repeat domain-containing protein [Spirochaetota bacterium]